MSIILGLPIVILIVGFIYKRDAQHWEYLAQTYERRWTAPLRERWGHAVLYGKFPASKSYNGIVKIGVHKDGLSLKIMIPVISFFCKPLFIPFHDIISWDQTWYINTKTVELELAGAPEIKIAMPREQVEWIRSKGGNDIKMMTQPSPYQNKPVIWYRFLLVTSLLFVISMLYILFATIFR